MQVVYLSDDNPTASRAVWKEFLEALIAEKAPLTLLASTRPEDVVRDADLLPLYKQAGVARLVLGFENGRGAESPEDLRHKREAVRLLRQNGILSMAACLSSGSANETDRDYWRALKQIAACDPDQITTFYAIPQHETPISGQIADDSPIQGNPNRWGCHHQMLASAKMAPWRIFLWMKLIEAAAQLRPSSVRRILRHPDPVLRHAMRRHFGIARRVWIRELWDCIFHDPFAEKTAALANQWKNRVKGGTLPPNQAMLDEGRHRLFLRLPADFERGARLSCNKLPLLP